MKRFKKIALILIAVLLIPIFQIPAVSDQSQVNLQVDTGIGPLCNQNGICDAGLGENSSNCSTDCGCNNNGVCQPARNENSANCSFDCPAGAIIIPDTSPPEIYNISVTDITLNSAKILWETKEVAVCQLFWGETSEYKEGIISEDIFDLSHSTELNNLSPETLYHFQISCREKNRKESQTMDQRFSTLTPPDITPPANIFDFEAFAADSRVALKWQNPPDSDFKEVRIVRSEDFYPFEPSIGYPIYEGAGTSFVDTGLKNGVRYYYTAFSYDRAGNYSSGAVVSAAPRKPLPPGATPLPGVTSTPEPAPPEIPPPETSPTVPLPPEIGKLDFPDFSFFQEDEEVSLNERKQLELKTTKPLTISLDYEKVPEVLKTIMVTLKKPASGPDEKEKSFSFLLRANKDKTNYFASLVPPEAGIYPFIVNILDYKNQNLKQIKGELIVPGSPAPKTLAVLWYKRWQNWLYILLGLLLAVCIIYFIKKKIRLGKSNYKMSNAVSL